MDNSSDSNSSREKIEASHLEKTGGTVQVSRPLDDGVVVPEYDEKEVKKILRRIDWRLLPVLTILYLLAFIGSCQNFYLRSHSDVVRSWKHWKCQSSWHEH